MKKILSVSIAMLMCVSLAGCRRNRENTDDRKFIIVSEEIVYDSELVVIADKDTSVCYLIYKSGHKGGITPLIGKDGKPVLYNNR